MNREQLTDYIKVNLSSGQAGSPIGLEIIDNNQAEPYFLIKTDDLLRFSRFVHDDPQLQMTFLMNVAAVDTGERFEVVYNVCSYALKHRLFFKIVLDREKPEIESVISVWPAANWYEREMWELYGINVRNHPNLTRFLLPDDWNEGFPMRKGWTGTDFIPLPERE